MQFDDVLDFDRLPETRPFRHHQSVSLNECANPEFKVLDSKHGFVGSGSYCVLCRHRLTGPVLECASVTLGFLLDLPLDNSITDYSHLDVLKTGFRQVLCFRPEEIGTIKLYPKNIVAEVASAYCHRLKHRHSSNHAYLVLSTLEVTLECHAPGCKDNVEAMIRTPIKTFPPDFRGLIEALLTPPPPVQRTKRHKELVEKYKNEKGGLYLAIVDDGLFKFGYTEQLAARCKQHEHTFRHFDLIYFIPSVIPKQCETRFKESVVVKDHRISAVFAGKTETELIRLTPVNGIDQFKLMEAMYHSVCVAHKEANLPPPPPYSNAVTPSASSVESPFQVQLEMEREKTRQVREREETARVREIQQTTRFKMLLDSNPDPELIKRFLNWPFTPVDTPERHHLTEDTNNVVRQWYNEDVVECTHLVKNGKPVQAGLPFGVMFMKFNEWWRVNIRRGDEVEPYSIRSFAVELRKFIDKEKCGVTGVYWLSDGNLEYMNNSCILNVAFRS
ncbi:hypothetical protein BJ741DRAFT_660879 [Chytriomyces cf. hyalinus JEL632]|nr:hypothetical protein BJ741DRAFT_660879 [Chytriomyces cf. hyalinus JEL632]